MTDIDPNIEAYLRTVEKKIKNLERRVEVQSYLIAAIGFLLGCLIALVWQVV